MSELGPELGRGGRALARSPCRSSPATSCSARSSPTGTRELDLARAVANQAAVAIKKIQVLERLTEKNLIKDFFEELAARRLDEATRGPRRPPRLRPRPPARRPRRGARRRRARARRRLARARDAASTAATSRCARSFPSTADGAARFVDELRRIHAELRQRRGDRRVERLRRRGGARATASRRRGTRCSAPLVLRATAACSATTSSAPTSTSCASRSTPSVRDSTIDAVAKLAEYDRERGASLLATLEEFLGRRGNISATSDALFVHPNTLRQRLRRIADLTGHRPPPRRLADGRDRREDGAAAGGPGRHGDAAHIDRREMWRNPTLTAPL